MEGFQKATRSVVTKDPLPTDLPSSSYNGGTGTGSGSASASHLLARPPRRAVSLLTCSKLCGFCFVAGIIVGYTLKKRVRRWAARLLRTIKDD